MAAPCGTGSGGGPTGRTPFHSPRRPIDRFAVRRRRGPRVNSQDALDGDRLVGEVAELILPGAEVAQPPRDADVGLELLDCHDGPLRGGNLAQAADVLAEPLGDAREFRLAAR